MLERKISGPEQDGSQRVKGRDNGQDLSTQILDAIEHGVILWSANGICLKFNDRIFEMLEFHPANLPVGTKMQDFLDFTEKRGDHLEPDLATLNELYALETAFQFDRTLPSGRVVSGNARPVRGGGYVVAYSDVTEARAAVSSLDVARADAIEAQRQAAEVLRGERARQHEASRLAKLDEWLQSCKSLSELFDIVTAFMKLVLPATRGQLFIYSNSRDVLELACRWNGAAEQDQVTPDSCWALRRGRRYIYEPEELCFLCDHVAEVVEGHVMREKYLCVPIVAHGDTVGMLHLEFESTDDNPEVVDTLSFATRCGEHISMAIANVKLRDELQDQSTRDPLTGLYNRRFFLETIRKELAQAASRQTSVALLAIDADKFKNFNDDHGHDAGDKVLEVIAEKMLAVDLLGAIACRIGGEEFSIILPNADRTIASSVAEELRQVIAEMRVKHMGAALPKVTISTGVAIYPTHGTQPQDLIKQADVALYAAKKAGRNCWKIAEGDGMISFE